MSKKFYDTDIDQILQHSTIIIHDKNHTSETNKNTIENDIDETDGIYSIDRNTNSQLMSSSVLPSFSKASFVIAGNDNNIAIDDPDFWSKIIGLELQDKKQEENITRTRRCKITAEGAYNGKMNKFFNDDFEDIEEEKNMKRKRNTVYVIQNRNNF